MAMLGFDHAVIAVPDLSEARERVRRLGFQTRPGAERAGRGVDTFLIRFGLDYLEVRGVHDAALARESDLDGPALVDYVAHNGGGLAGYALRTTDLDGMAQRLTATSMRAFTHLQFEGPFALSRRTDGHEVSWHMLMLGGVVWRRAWPMLVQWDLADDERHRLEPPDQHPNTVTGVAGIALVVASLESARAVYHDQLGLDAAVIDEVPSLMASRATYRLGGCAIQLLAPQGDESPLEETLGHGGEGLFELTLAVKDLAACRNVLEQEGIAYHTAPDNPGALALEGAEALGARLVFTAAPGTGLSQGGPGTALRAEPERAKPEPERTERAPAGHA